MTVRIRALITTGRHDYTKNMMEVLLDILYSKKNTEKILRVQVDYVRG